MTRREPQRRSTSPWSEAQPSDPASGAKASAGATTTTLIPLLGAILLLAGCGAAGAGDDDDGGGIDAGAGCMVAIGVTPAQPEAPVTLVATAFASDLGFGLVDYQWTASGPSGPITPLPRNADGSEVEIPAQAAGVYEISVNVIVGGSPSCNGFTSKNVTAAGALTRKYRLRYTPLPGDAPPQDDPTPVSVTGGGDLSVGTRVLDPGQSVDASLLGPAGAGVGAELRLSAGGRAYTLYAGSTGAYTGRVLSGTSHELVVVPFDYALAPQRFAAQSATAIDAGYSLTAGDEVTGSVVGPGGSPVVGAWVSVSTGGLPPTLAQTAIDGSFSAHARGALGPLRVLVVPPDGSGLARLEAAESLALTAAGGAVSLRLSDRPIVSVSVDARSSGGAAIPGARVTFVAADVGGASAVQGGMTRVAKAPVRVTVVADGSGRATAQLPAGDYVAVVEPSQALAGAETLRVHAVDLQSAPGAPIPLATAAASAMTFLVTDESGAPLTGARVTATSPGAYGIEVDATSSATTDDVQGSATISLVPALMYEVVVEPRAGQPLARAHKYVLASVGGGQVTIALEPALTVTGVVGLPAGGGLGMVRVAAFCIENCGAGESPLTPSAETVTNAVGAFTLRLPDPGVAP